MIQVVLFDWGDTVMQVLPEYEGPMAHWPRVEAVPGIEGVLHALQPRFRLALVTNAADSGAPLVREALRRVGLETYFEEVLTARELGVRKPDPAFFQMVLGELTCGSREAALVGDDYRSDVIGAKQMGMRAIWFNRAACSEPPVPPLYDAEVHKMVELPSALDSLYLPDVAECLMLLAGQETPSRVLRHSEAVATVAFRLATWLKERGEDVDPLLAHRGGLLHDLDKISSRLRGQPHGRLGAEVLRRKGYPVLADIVEKHLITSILDPTDRPATWEEKLVFYADKIVEDNEVVSVAERMAALRQRYPRYAETFHRSQPLVFELEAAICHKLGTSPPGLVEEARRWVRSAGSHISQAQ